MDYYFSVDHRNPTPLYAQLAQSIKEEIRSGSIPFGEKLPSENELSELCSLSRMTVRNALAELVNDHYVEKLHGKGTFVCYNASTSPNAGSIDVLLGVTYSYFSMLYIKSISEVLTLNRYQCVIHDTRDDQENICSTLERILANGSAGIIIQPHHTIEPLTPELREQFSRLWNRGIPYVMLDRGLDGIPGAKMVFDDRMGARLAAEYLCSLGHQRFAMVCSSDFCENAPRLEGFNSVLEENGLAPAFAVEDGPEADQQLLPLIREKQVTAVFNYSDKVAVRTMRLLQSAGIRIPEDVSVVGFDDTFITMATSPQLTSVIHPKETLGRLAAEKLISIIENKEHPVQDKLLRPRLHIQASCAAPRKEELK